MTKQDFRESYALIEKYYFKLIKELRYAYLEEAGYKIGDTVDVRLNSSEPAECKITSRSFLVKAGLENEPPMLCYEGVSDEFPGEVLHFNLENNQNNQNSKSEMGKYYFVYDRTGVMLRKFKTYKEAMEYKITMGRMDWTIAYK